MIRSFKDVNSEKIAPEIFPDAPTDFPYSAEVVPHAANGSSPRVVAQPVVPIAQQ